MSTLRETCFGIEAVDDALGAACERLLDGKTKPRRSLGRLEELACQLAAARRTPLPAMPEKAIVVMGADHGVATEGVSAYPQEVTRQMLLNFAAGGAAINVLARYVGAELVVVDMGIKSPLPPTPQIRAARLGPGTRSFTAGPAMSRDQAIAALEVGIEIARELAARGTTLVGIGEMGIGNSTSASALTAALTGAAPAAVTGRGTGIDDPTLRRKIEVVRRGLEVNQPDRADAIDCLAKLGGFEIAGLAGVVLGAARARVPVVIDGFIASVAALIAARVAPRVVGYLIAAHLSVEVGHEVVLRELRRRPLLALDMRLGEGTGAALAMALVDASLHILHEMATFQAAGVSDSGA